MKQIKSLSVKCGLLLLLALSLLLTSCGKGAFATTMHLRRTAGTVGISDGEGKDVEPQEDLGLYSGYGVNTQAESYAWIDLDDVKLTKLDQDSEITITKESKNLEIEVKAGSLFFNVTEPDPVELALEQYRVIVGQADTYDYYSVDDPTGAYRYSLVRMDPEDTVPALLLEQDTTFGISSVLVFRYDVASKTVLQAASTLAEGVASAGGYRGSLSAAEDGNGLLSTEFSSGSGQGSTSRVTLDGDMLRSETIWEGNVFDGTGKTYEETGSVDIDWHDISDTSALGS